MFLGFYWPYDHGGTLASKPDDKLLGKTEFEVRDRVHTIGAKALETALNERKKGATKGPA